MRLTKRETKIDLEGNVLNSDRTGSIVRELHLRQHVCPVRSIVAKETSYKLLKRDVAAFR
jgi:hypothetical protein